MTELEQVEIQITVAKEMQAMRDSMIKLSSNTHFKNIIEKGYFKEEAARLVMAKSAPLNEQQQAVIDGMILGIGALSNYFEMIIRRGREMDAALGEHEETREQILAEELTNG